MSFPHSVALIHQTNITQNSGRALLSERASVFINLDTSVGDVQDLVAALIWFRRFEDQRVEDE